MPGMAGGMPGAPMGGGVGGGMGGIGRQSLLVPTKKSGPSV